MVVAFSGTVHKHDVLDLLFEAELVFFGKNTNFILKYINKGNR